jgi:DNA-binding FrmR family transcriptional regulator
MNEEPSTAPQTPGYQSDIHALLNRLRRIEGQVRGLHRMVESEAYCIDILTQVSAVTSALQNVAIALLEDHLRHCVIDAARLSPEEGTRKLEEATHAIARLVRS